MIPTGDPSIPPHVQGTKEIKELIIEKSMDYMALRKNFFLQMMQRRTKRRL